MFAGLKNAAADIRLGKRGKYKQAKFSVLHHG